MLVYDQKFQKEAIKLSYEIGATASKEQLQTGVTDLRRAVDGLVISVKQKFNMDLFGNYLFLFCNMISPEALSWNSNRFVIVN